MRLITYLLLCLIAVEPMLLSRALRKTPGAARFRARVPQSGDSFSALGETVDMEGASGASQTLYNPIFGGSPIVSAQAGNWSSTGTWVGGVVPGEDDDVQIKHSVSLDGTGRIARHIVIENTGTLSFANSSALSAQSVIVTGTSHQGRGHLKMGDANSPISCTLAIRDVAVDPEGDPWQFWGGVCVVNYGKWTMHGVVRNVRSLYFEATAGATTVDLFDLHNSFTRFDYEIGDPVEATVSLLTLPADPSTGSAATLTGWAVGDRLFFPGTLSLDFTGATSAAAIGAEWRTIAAIDGNTVTLNAALTYNHFGQDSADGNLHYYPVVDNLTRSITIKSENPAGVRGHTLWTHRAQVDRRYYAIEDMGRSLPTTEAVEDEPGSIRGRYSDHAHHGHGPVGGIADSVDGAANGYACYDYGYSIYNTVSPGHVTWLKVIHDVSFGYFGYGSVNWYYGAGLITEEGVEVENIFEHNRVMFGTGDGGRLDTQGEDDPGLAGSAMWFHSAGNRVRFNVAANAHNSGQYVWGMNTYQASVQASHDATKKFQTEVGQDRHDDGEDRIPNSQNFLQHEGNYLFSCNALHTGWSIATFADTGTPYDGDGGEVVDLIGWNSYGYGMFFYEQHQVAYKKVVMLDARLNSDFWLCYDYRNTEVTVEDTLCEGLFVSPSYTELTDGTPDTLLYGTMSFTNCIFDRFKHEPLHGNGGGQGVPGRELTLDTCVFRHATETILQDGGQPAGREDARNITIVLNYRREFDDPAGDDFRLQPDYRPALPNAQSDRSEITCKIFDLP